MQQPLAESLTYQRSDSRIGSHSTVLLCESSLCGRRMLGAEPKRFAVDAGPVNRSIDRP